MPPCGGRAISSARLRKRDWIIQFKESTPCSCARTGDGICQASTFAAATGSPIPTCPEVDLPVVLRATEAQLEALLILEAL